MTPKYLFLNSSLDLVEIAVMRKRCESLAKFTKYWVGSSSQSACSISPSRLFSQVFAAWEKLPWIVTISNRRPIVVAGIAAQPFEISEVPSFFCQFGIPVAP